MSATPLRSKLRTSNSGERSIIKLKPAFVTGKRKAASTRTQSISPPQSGAPLAGSPGGRGGRRYRVAHVQGPSECPVRIRSYTPDLEAIQDISKNIDQLSDIVEALKLKSTPIGPFAVPSPPQAPRTDPRPAGTPLKVRKSTRPKLVSWLEGNLGIDTELSKGTEILYKKRFEAVKIMVVKETKPKKTTKQRKDTLPMLKKM